MLSKMSALGFTLVDDPTPVWINSRIKIYCVNNHWRARIDNPNGTSEYLMMCGRIRTFALPEAAAQSALRDWS